MPAKNPRITITLEPKLAAQFRKLSELTGESQSALISSLLETSSGVFDRTIQVLEAANEAKAELRGKMATDMASAQAKLEGQLGLALDTFDAYTGDLLKDTEAIKRRARRGASGLPADTARNVPTPISNRGVRSTSKTAKKPAKSRS